MEKVHIEFIPSRKMIAGISASDVDQQECGELISIELDLVHINELDNGAIRIDCNPVIWHTDGPVRITRR